MKLAHRLRAFRPAQNCCKINIRPALGEAHAVVIGPKHLLRDK
jgi:hypothetical protein